MTSDRLRVGCRVLFCALSNPLSRPCFTATSPTKVGFVQPFAIDAIQFQLCAILSRGGALALNAEKDRLSKLMSHLPQLDQ
jgi:hypothetical protein